ncbi:hypothetical protein KC19_2G188200 [Ceratodon purpureus]|uniref:non-specific serine/threonine protein kinase n=1 Tax=Ceratodon purpureus TaxID=3225 RepID=A0A8T0IXW0_CERPU|nr:hypothetical protein KC19_2G188200 [Ceratodon purpureus]
MATVQSEADRVFIVALHIGSHWCSYAHKFDDNRPDGYIADRQTRLGRSGPSRCAIYYEPGDAATAKVKSWGTTASDDHEWAVDLARQRPRLAMSKVGTYFESFVGARESSTALLKNGFTLIQVISDYLRLMGASIMSELQQDHGFNVSMDDVQWCFTVAQDWGDHGMKLMRMSLERAWLVQSAISRGGSPYPLRFVPELDGALYYIVRTFNGNSHIKAGDKLLSLTYILADFGCKLSHSLIKAGDKLLTCILADFGYKSSHISVQEVYSAERSKFEVKQVVESVENLGGPQPWEEMFMELLMAKMLPVQDNALKVYAFKQFLRSHVMDLGFDSYMTGYKFALPIDVQNRWKELDVEHGNPIRNSYGVIELTEVEFDRAMKPCLDEYVEFIRPQLLSTPGIEAILLVGALSNFTYFVEKVVMDLHRPVDNVFSVASMGAVAMVGDQVLPFTWKGGGKLPEDGAPASSSHGDGITGRTISPEISGVLPGRGFTSPSIASSNASGGSGASKPSLEKKPSNSRVESVVKKYSWDQVWQMTEGLTSRELGKGGFGTVYIGKLENGKEVAVKVLNQSSQEGKLETFVNEVNLLMQVNHVNLVKLMGYCQDERDIVIYKYMEEGSIGDHLHGDKRRLNWKERLNIVLQAARGIEYLHFLCSSKIIHRDIKSENILLTRDMVAKVADFGISRLMGGDEANNSHLITRVMGSPGYLDPEYYETGRLRHSSDVYSFGIVLLEMITSRKPIPNPNDASCCIGPWVKRNYGRGGSGAMKAVVDSSLSGNYNPKAMKLVIKLAISCINHGGGSRPKMSEVVCVLQKALTMELEEKKSWIPFI